MKVLIIGAGRMGTAAGYLFKKAGLQIAAVCNKHLSTARKAVEKIGEGQVYSWRDLEKDFHNGDMNIDLILITTPDDKIAVTAEKINNWLDKKNNKYTTKNKLIMMHMSGALSSEILISSNKQNKKNRGFLSLHPLCSAASFAEGIELLAGAYYTMEGNTVGLEFGRKLADMMKVNYDIIDKRYKPLYHAAAVISSNYLVTLVNSSYEIFEKIGLESTEAQKGVLELAKGVLKNIEKLGIIKSLTGPAVREDWQTVQKHLDFLEKCTPEFLSMYQILAEKTGEIKDDNKKGRRENE